MSRLKSGNSLKGGKIELKHIELFAGCGGMSLGVEKAGFKLLFANELSPMAGETFAYNILGENLQKLADQRKVSQKVCWIKSQFQADDLKSRLRENPFEFTKGKVTDFDESINLNGKLIIGNIDDLLEEFTKRPKLCAGLKKMDIDLLSGGPPCQSFSLAGKREKDNKKNLLPLSFAEFAGIIKPKIVLLENVKGITNPFSIGEDKYHAWVEVAKAFCLQGYIPVCMMLNSKYFGVPQNRPRFILIAFREDVAFRLIKQLSNSNEVYVLNNAIAFYKITLAHKNKLTQVTEKDLKLFDIEKNPDYFTGGLLPSIITGKGDFCNAEDAISDLMFNHQKSNEESTYVKMLNDLFSTKTVINKLLNHQVRTHSIGVKARFRWFQIISNLNGLSQDAFKLIAGHDVGDEKLKKLFDKIKTKPVLFNSEKKEERKLNNIQEFQDYIKSLQTKKHSQRAIKADEPAPAQLTIPDDLCHYSPSQLRTLTVREMARFQSFPDWFEFRSKVTTGGNQRGFEVPQYTQVGNAVPPLLAYHLGSLVKKILNKLSDGKSTN